MIDVDKWQEIFSSIKQHKLRTALTAFGVAWGIFILVLMLGAISGLQNSFEYDFRDDAVNSLWIWNGTTSKDYNGLNKGRRIRFDNGDYEYIRDQVEGVAGISGRLYLSGDQIVKYDKETVTLNVRSCHPDHKALENTQVFQGRYINDTDISAARKIAVIGKEAKRLLFGEEVDAIGKEIAIGKINYKVVGVFYDTGGESEMKRIYIPISTAQKLYADGNRIDQLIINGGDLDVHGMSQLETKIQNALAFRKQFDPADRRAIGMYNAAEEFQEFDSLFSAFDIITWVIGILSIMAGVIGVSNIMLIIVKDRTKEIGIRKAIGATPRSIVMMIMQEAVFITAVAGFLGMIAGIALIYLASGAEAEYFRRPQVDINVVISATLVLVLAGTLAGVIPAIKAANINPVQAIKSE